MPKRGPRIWWKPARTAAGARGLVWVGAAGLPAWDDARDLAAEHATQALARALRDFAAAMATPIEVRIPVGSPETPKNEP